MDKVDEPSIGRIQWNEREYSLSACAQHILGDVRSLCSRAAVSDAIARLRENSDIALWVEQGRTLHERHSSMKCEFCAQAIPEDRWKQLEAHFSKEDQELKEAIERALESVAGVKQKIASVLLPDRLALYSDFRDRYDEARAAWDAAVAAADADLGAVAANFANLAPADFEDLVRDLIGRELGVRFEAFGPGPDGGMDGRHARGRGTIILQAKHYAGSPFRSLLSAMKRERKAIDRLTPNCYLLATSRVLSPPNKRSLGKEIGPALEGEADIYSAGDLNGLLRKYPDIQKAHIKLWLSSAAVLERVMRAAAYAHAAITQEEIAAKVRVYAPNPSFKDARDRLESQHVLIISGPPGVGKTTLAEMLSYAYVGEGWKLTPIRSLDDGFASIVDPEKQIFLFDDFLGKVALDRSALASKDSDLSRFMKRIRNSPNARFILTTRAYIFEEARRISEYLSEDRIDISKYGWTSVSIRAVSVREFSTITFLLRRRRWITSGL